MHASKIFLLDDDPVFRQHVRSALAGMYTLVEAASEEEFRAQFRPFTFAVLLLDMRLRRDREGMDVLREVLAQDESQAVIMVSGYGDTESAIDAVGAGAMMFLHKREFTPVLLARMVTAVMEQARLRRKVKALRKLAWSHSAEMLLGDSPGVREAAEGLRSAALEPGRLPVIVGERGTGTSFAARLFHLGGKEPDAPLVEIAGDELERGSDFFEGENAPWIEAYGGTLVLDRAEKIPPKAGQRLLDRLEADAEQAPARVVFLQHAPAAERRLSSGAGSLVPWLARLSATVPVHLPPLRQRTQDIALLAIHFLQRQRAAGHTAARSISGSAIRQLEEFSWPGNVRELQSAVEYAALQAGPTTSELSLEHFPAQLAGRRTREKASRPAGPNWDFRLHLARTEVELVERAIQERGLSQKTALAKALGYNDRYILMRRLSKALQDFPALGSEFPATSKLFGGIKPA